MKSLKNKTISNIIKSITGLTLGLLVVLSLSITASAATESEKAKAVDAVAKAIANTNTSANVSSYNIKNAEVGEIIEAAINQELLTYDSYLGVRTAYSYVPSTGKVNNIRLTYSSSRSQMLSRRNASTKKINEIKAMTDKAMTDSEKALIVHDYIASHTDYDYKNYVSSSLGQSSFSAYGVLINNTGVCQGYARAFQIIMGQLGVETVRVSSASMNHEWNLIKADGAWYHVDITWDDPVWDNSTEDIDREQYVSHKYFLRTDSEMRVLGYYGWDADVSATSRSYSNWKLRSIEAPIIYDSGYWVYVNNSDKLVKSKMNGSSTKTLKSNVNYVGEFGNKLYYTTNSMSIRSCDYNGKSDKTEMGMSSLLDYTKYSKVKYMEVSSKGNVKVLLLDYKKSGAATLKPYYKNVNYSVKTGSYALNGKVIKTTKKKAAVKAPKKTKITKIRPTGKKRVALTWKKTSGTTGYVVYRSTKKKSGYTAVKTIKKASTVKFTDKVKKVKKNKKVYYKIRAYKTSKGKRVYSAYSAVRQVKLK